MTPMQRFYALICAICGAAASFGLQPSRAEPSPATPSMTCAAVQGLIRARGAMVLHTGPHLYDRYVDHAGFCPQMMRTQAAWVPTRDNPQCFIGYTCEQPNLRPHR